MYANDVPINLAKNWVLLKRKHMIMPIDGFSMIFKIWTVSLPQV